MNVYYNGGFHDSGSLIIDSSLPHFRHGAGFFETILYDGAEICWLERHVERLTGSCEEFGFGYEECDYHDIIIELIRLNGLAGDSARVNICQMAEGGDSCRLFISAQPYTPPPEEKVFKLCIYPRVHDSYLAGYKSMSYMHFLLAKKFAAKEGCDDAILTDSSGHVLETSTAGILLEQGGVYYAPEGQNKLPSIAVDVFSETHEVKYLNILIDNISSYNIYLLNSLMGVRRGEL